MKILISAYSCAPHRGSEPGIGWNTACELSKKHEVWVVTNARSREEIEPEIAVRPRAQLHFLYYEIPPLLRLCNRNGPLLQLHYMMWQYGVYFLARRLHKEIGFDVVHHSTFGRYWSPSLFALLKAPFVWGPVGGGETVPREFRGCLRLGSRLVEYFKDYVFGISMYGPFLRTTVRRSNLILADTQNTAKKLTAIAERPIDYMSVATIDDGVIEIIDEIDATDSGLAPEHVCFVTLTRLMPWKGIHLGLHALKRLNNPNARYWIVGDGPERSALEKLAESLGVEDQVVFWGNPSREEWMRLLKQSHALLHSPLANTFNMIVVEAMVCSKPVVGLSLGSVKDQLNDEIGYPVPASNPEEAIKGLANAMQAVIDNPQEAAERGIKARQHALSSYTWKQRIERMNEYLEKVTKPVGNGNYKISSARACSTH